MSVTQLALNAIINVEAQTLDDSSPEKVLDYLQDDSHFKSLDAQLKETMVKAGLCNEAAPSRDFVDTLFNRLSEQSHACGEEPNPRRTVERWLSGKTASIRSRSDMIRIVFALELDFEQANELLNKCGFSGLNVRNAEDAAYMYCILNGRPFQTALSLLADYYEDTGRDIPADNAAFDHSGNTTQILENSILGESNWENDDAFLHSFLLPNKKKFLDYTTSAVKEYYRLKNELFAIAILNAIDAEWSSVADRVEKELLPGETNTTVTNAAETALRKQNNEASLLYPAYLVFGNHSQNAEKAIENVSQIAYENPDMASQKMISAFFDDIMTMEGVLKTLIQSIKDRTTNADGNHDESRIRKYTDSILKKSVMKEFPKPNTFANFESDYTLLNKNMSMRKAIILMCYLIYAYEFTNDIYPQGKLFHVSNRFSAQESGLGFLAFKEYVDTLLKNTCKMGPLYPGCQFDWLVLRSIRQIEVFSGTPDDAEGEESLVFFDKVLLFSFGEDNFL